MTMASKPTTLIVATALLVVVGGDALAQPSERPSTNSTVNTGDYDAYSERWNGINTLGAVAKGLGLRVDAVSSIDWEDLDSSDLLIILYPTERVDPGHIAAFIRGGGRLLLGDDFGNSDEALGRLGMLRDRAIGVGARSFYRDLPYVPMAVPLLPDHPLATGIAEVATNHPAVLSKVTGPEVVFGFGESEGIIAAGALGRGRFVVSSDPSIFINRMLQFEGNLQLAVNTLRFLAREGITQRAVILAGDFALYGEPENVLDDGTVGGTMANMLSELNRWLDERNDYLLTAPGMSAVAIILAIIVGLVALISLPLTRKALFDGSWVKAQSPAPSMEGDNFEEIVGAYDHEGRNNFLLPATVIRDTVNTRLARLLNEPDPLHARSEASLLDAVAEKAGTNASHALQRMYRRIKNLPSRAHAASPWSSAHLSRKEFEALERKSDIFFQSMGKTQS